MSGDHFIFEHISNASSWNELCIRKPTARSSDSGVDVFVARNMPCIRPRGSVGAAWTTRKDAKTGGKNETAFPKEDVKTDSIGDAIFTVNNVGTIQDSCDLKKKKIGKRSAG